MNKLDDLPQNMFKLNESKISSVDISRNRFTNLPLALRNPTRLLFLNLDGNMFALDEEDQFINPTQLVILHLADKKIRVIKENAFLGLKKLMVLYLDENAIRNIEADLSQHTPLLMTIILKDNVLTDTPNLGNLPILSKIS